MADSASIQPNTTLYINNLNDKINKDEIRSQLYALFTTYGKLIDVVATKTPKMRGQAFLVFTDLPSATAAFRACDGMIFYNKPMVRPCRFSPVFYLSCQVPPQHISYAKGKSYATLRREDPNFIPPNFSHASSAKRLREAEESNMRAKRERVDEDDEEMDIDDDDDDDAGPPAPAASNSTSCIIFYRSITQPCFTSSFSTIHVAQVQPSNKLHCSNLPQEVTNGVLAVLFQQYVLMGHPLIIHI